MRDYAKVEPKAWHGGTFKDLRKRGSEALIVGLYLITSPSSNMLGLFAQPILYMAHETGLGEEGALKGLQWCIEAAFCSYDHDTEVVWVHEMARYQVAAELKANDLRCKGIQREYDALPDNPFLSAFFDRYGEVFHLSNRREPRSPIEGAMQGAYLAPSKPRTGTGTGAGAGEPSASSPAKLPTTPVAALIDLYHEVLPELPKVKLQTTGRVKALQSLWRFVLTKPKTDGSPRATNAEEAVAWIRGYFARARENEFLMGKTPRTGEHANWKCDLDFLLTERGMKHVIEKTGDGA